MAWTYEVDTDLVAKNFTTTLKLDVFGGINANVTLDFAPTAQKKSVVKGSIDYECKRSKFHKEDGPGGCVMYNLKREPPAESPKIVVTLLENQIPGALKIGALSGTYKLIQPKVTVTPNMQVTESNENQCYNVFVDVTAEFTPGQIDFSFTFPLTIPGLKNLSLSGTALIGAPAKTRLQAEYRICCCAWNDSLPVAEGEEPPADDEDPIEQGDLKCGEKIVNLSCTVTGDIATLPMTIKAREQDCPFFDHMSKKKGVNEKFPGKPGQEVTRPK